MSRNKYNARKVHADGYTFDSQAEWRRYCDLRLLEYAGDIRELEVHRKFELLPGYRDRDGKKERAITYVADFVYEERDGQVWVMVVEDVKGGRATQTAAFRIKWKLLGAKFPGLRRRIYTGD